MNTNNIFYNKLLHLFIAISFITTILFISHPSFFDLSFAQQDKDDDGDSEKDKGDKLIVKTRIQINNLDLENTEFIRVIGFINGQEAKEDISISSIDKTKKT